MFALTAPPPNGLSRLIHFTRWPIMQKVHRYFVDNAEIYGINSWIDWINQRNRESTESILSLDWL